MAIFADEKKVAELMFKFKATFMEKKHVAGAPVRLKVSTQTSSSKV